METPNQQAPSGISIESPSSNASHIYAWLEQQPSEVQVNVAGVLFQSLLEYAAKPRHLTKHACIKLCSFVELCLESRSGPLAKWASSDENCLTLFDFFVEWNEKDPHRTLRLVLELTARLLIQNSTDDTTEPMKISILDTLVSIITRKSTRPQAKSAIGALDLLLQKEIFSVDEIGRSYRLHNSLSENVSEYELWKMFCSELFEWINQPHVCAVAGKFFSNILRDLSRKRPESFGPRTWQIWLQEFLLDDPSLLEPTKNYILSPLFQTDRKGSLAFLRSLNSVVPESTTHSGQLDITALLQLAGLEMGKRVALVEEPEDDDDESSGEDGDVITLKERVLTNVLAHPSFGIRILALSLLISSRSTTKPYSRRTFDILKRYLPAYHTDTDAKFRFETFVLSKALIKRTCGAIAVLTRSTASDIPVSGRKTPVLDANSGLLCAADNAPELSTWLHKDFLHWHFVFLSSELGPTASYQRHIAGLKTLIWLLRTEFLPSVMDAHQFIVLTSLSWARSVLDLLVDPFDEVREHAAVLISMLSFHGRDGLCEPDMLDRTTLNGMLQEYCDRAKMLATSTGRGSHADGVARLHQLLCAGLQNFDKKLLLVSGLLETLEMKILLAETNLGQAALEAPMHADIAALGYIWEHMSSIVYNPGELAFVLALQRRVVSSCLRIWALVRHVLCDDSPEGHLPQEVEEIEGLDSKDLVSYSFRAVIEASNLTQLIAGNVDVAEKECHISAPIDMFETIGTLAFEQLSSLRHRGALTAVAQTFTYCCKLATRFENEISARETREESLVEKWYKGALGCISAQVSTTRRSAGIPALIVGILSSDSKLVHFGDVLKDLVRIAEKPAKVSETDGSRLPQVHALNCLKEALKTSSLTRSAESHISECLQLATNSMKSEVWAIRNCGLLLLRSIMDSIFGTGDSKEGIEKGWDGKSLRISYSKYNNLPAILVDLLRQEKDSQNPGSMGVTAESVFPALDIVRRAGPPEIFRETLYEHISAYLGSPTWRVRELAARTVCSFLLNDDEDTALNALLSETSVETNRIHGTLMLIAAIIERQRDLVQGENDGRFAGLLERTNTYVLANPVSLQCDETRAEYIRVVNIASSTDRSDEGDLYDVIKEGESVLGYHKLDPASKSALLRSESAIRGVFESLKSGDVLALEATLSQTLNSDIDTTRRVLVAISARHRDPNSELAEVYLILCGLSDSPDILAILLDRLTESMDAALKTRNLGRLPTDQALTRVWRRLRHVDTNPSLSNSIVRFSGPMMAARVFRSDGNISAPATRALQNWGAMLAEAGTDENTFDTRLAAVEALRSFFAIVPMSSNQAAENPLLPSLLPAILAMYDALSDDDDEIRNIASEAANAFLGRVVVAVYAAPGLLQWVANQQLQSSTAAKFWGWIVSRMAGSGKVPGLVDGSYSEEKWTPAEVQLEEAMRLDDSLFRVEEQNLFTDPVRETERLARVFRTCPDSTDNDSIQALAKWAMAGLERLNHLVAKDDGPLGWTSNKKAFAISARVLICASALACRGGCPELAEGLRKIHKIGTRSRLHRLLLNLAVLDTTKAA